MRYLILPLLATVAFTACYGQKQVKKTSGVSTTSDILSTNRDMSINPANDFFQYANGGWIKSNPIPDDQSSWGIGNAVQEELYKRLRIINDQSLKSTTGIEKKVGDFWHSAMDTVSIDRERLKPIEGELKEIDGITDVNSLLHVLADFQIKGIGSGFSAGVGQDSKNSDVYAYYLNQGGLGLPNRDYYFKNDERTQKIRAAYKDYLTKVFQYFAPNKQEAQNWATAHFDFEKRLADSSRKLEDLRDPYKNYNKYAIKDLGKLSPSINWTEMLTRKGVKTIDSVIVGQPEFFRAFEKNLTTNLLTWKNYLRFHLIRSTAAYLDHTTYQQYFDFYGKTLRGALKPKARWKRMLDLEDGLMGEALGRVFVKEYFNEKAKERYSNLVEDIRTALKERIQKLDWMSESTKQTAYVKLATMKKKVGYPDKWKDFSAMDIKRQPLVRNVIAANTWWHYYDVNKLGKPVDRDEWEMNPQTYNAYYNPSNNEIVLPAGIFTVPGYRDEQLDDALVYGYAGATTIGHEITHGFDDEGRQYDEKGNLHNWWTPQDSAEFAKRAQMMVKQFNEFVVVDSAHINGEATLGENIADLGGALLGIDAFKKTEAYKSGKAINGMTPMQRYFLGYSLGWLEHKRKEELATRLLTDVHSPAKWRVNGPFVNVPDFYSAWKIKKGSPMYREDNLRVRIW